MNNVKSIQLNNHSTGEKEYMNLQNRIWDTHQIEATVVVFPDYISIKPKSGTYSDYVLCRSAIRQIVTKPVKQYVEI